MSTQSSEEAFNERIEELKATYDKYGRKVQDLLVNPQEAGHSVVLHLEKVTCRQAISDTTLIGRDRDSLVILMMSSVRDVILRIGELREEAATTLVSPFCRGCNTKHVLDDEGQYSAQIDKERKIKWLDEEEVKLARDLHEATIFTQLIAKLIGCSSPLLSPEDCNALERSLLMDEPSQRIVNVFRGKLTVEDLTHLPILFSVKLLQTGSFLVPVLTRSAAALLSIMISRRPATVLAYIGDPEEFCVALFQYIVELSTNVCNVQSLLNERYGVAALLDILPALYHLSDWADARNAVDEMGLPHMLGSLCVHIIHSATQSLTCESDSCPCRMKDASIDYAQFPQLMDCVNLAERCYGNVELVNQHPESVAVVAILEILTKWERHGIKVAAASADFNDEIVPLADAFKTYVPRMTQLVEQTPSLRGGVEMMTRLSQHQIPEDPIETVFNTGLVRCHLASCPKTEDLQLCTGCKLAVYCCSQHQREHWMKHKVFCKKQKALLSSKR